MVDKKKRGVGRPRSLDEAKKLEIVAILSVGGDRVTAARYVGCHEQTIRNTAERDPAFAARLQQAESTHEIVHLRNINTAANEPRYWRAAAWALERMYPDRYAHRRPQTVTSGQVAHLLSQFATILLEEVECEEERQRAMQRVDQLLGETLVPADDLLTEDAHDAE